MQTYAYKTKNSDFRVTEILNLVLDSGAYNYYIMRKNGIRTIDVIDILATDNGLELSDITYAGLKDEDAITMQYLAIKNTRIDNCEKKLKNGEYSLNYVGSSSCPIEIGRLQGNSFRIRLRDLNLGVAEKIKKWEKHAFPVINYFDTQRFGMPGMQKLAHCIGKKLMDENYEEALCLMLDSGNIDRDVYGKWKGKAKEYFDSIELRRKGFFLSAFDSFEWNNTIKEVLNKKCNEIIEYQKEGIEFVYVTMLKDILREALDDIRIVWHRFSDDGNIYVKNSFRQPYLFVIYRASEIMQDDYYNGKYMLDIDFTLPAGAYATNVIDQIMCILEKR